MVYRFRFSDLVWGSFHHGVYTYPALAHSVEGGQVVDVAIFMELAYDFKVSCSAGYFGGFHEVFPFDGEGFFAIKLLPYMEQHGEQPDMGKTDPWIFINPGHKVLQCFFYLLHLRVDQPAIPALFLFLGFFEGNSPDS